MKKNHIVLFANTKGGVGKSCLCALFSTYLAQRGERVAVIDADLQQSLVEQRQEELAASPDAQIPWSLNSIDDFDDLPTTLPKMKSIDGWIIIDTPGTLNDENLLPIFQVADYAIVPIFYDAPTLRSTRMFAATFSHFAAAKMIFLPNRINGMEGRLTIERQREVAKEMLQPYGPTVARIKQSVVVQRNSTIQPLTYYQTKAVQFSFDWIINIINNKEKL